MVTTPEQYRWSSYAWHAWGQTNPYISDHALYQSLAPDTKARQFAYRDLFKHQIPEADIHQIREAIAYNYPLGNDQFRSQIETALGRRVGEKKRGHPVMYDESA